MNDTLLTIILVLFICGISMKMYLDSDYFNLRCIVSSVNGKEYCVRERSKSHLVVDILAKTSIKMDKLIAHLKEKYPDRDNVKRLVKKCNPSKIKEILPTSKYTAYSENKGEKLAFCATTKKDNSELIDENTLMFVALHEMSHIASKTIGHNEEFWKNFRFLIHESKEIGIYQPENYKKQPKEYCGMTISDNPYYDM